MDERTVLVTGASGCVGHYVLDALLADPRTRVRALVRDPARLRPPLREHPRVELVIGTMEDADHGPRAAGVDGAVHLAADWGGPRTFDINVGASHALFDALADAGCRRAVYFSTASVIDQSLQPLAAAGEIGTDYVRSKHEAFVGLGRTRLADRVVTVFPTLIFGGDDAHPASHIARGLPGLKRHMWLVRHLTVDGSFQFIHARDLGRIAARLLDDPAPPRVVAAGNPAVTAREAVDALCAYLGLRIPFRVDATALIPTLLRLFGAHVSPWDDYCMRQRHLVYDGAWWAGPLGLPTDLATLPGVLAATPGF